MPFLAESPYRLKGQGVMFGLIALISIIYFVQANVSYSYTHQFSAIPDEIVAAWESIRSGNFSPSVLEELLTLITAALLHANLAHLGGNMLYLWGFGAVACELLGARWIIPIFIFTAITGNLTQVAMNLDSPIPTLGASGAVMGFEGLYLAMFVRWRLPDPHVWPMASPVPPSRLAILGILGLIMDFNGYTSGVDGVAYGAHLGGFIGGLILGSFVVPMPRTALPR